MTTLLVGTFVISGVHTLLWLPRAFQMRSELRAAEAQESERLEAERSGAQKPFLGEENTDA
jgi:hypothetical protein